MQPPASAVQAAHEALEDYRVDGVVCLRSVFDPEWIDVLAAGVEAAESRLSARSEVFEDRGGRPAHYNDLLRWHDVEPYKRFIAGSPAAAVAGTLLETREVRVFYDSVFVRKSGVKSPTPWHQDVPYWCVAGKQICTVWTPLDRVERESALEFVRGSHCDGVQYAREPFGHDYFSGEDSAVQDVPDIGRHREDYDIIGWAMEPGDCLVFDGMVLHGGVAHLAPDRQLRAVSVRWLGDDAVYAPDKPGGVAPDLSVEVAPYDIKPGSPLQCPLFPVMWQQAD